MSKNRNLSAFYKIPKNDFPGSTQVEKHESVYGLNI